MTQKWPLVVPSHEADFGPKSRVLYIGICSREPDPDLRVPKPLFWGHFGVILGPPSGGVPRTNCNKMEPFWPKSAYPEEVQNGPKPTFWPVPYIKPGSNLDPLFWRASEPYIKQDQTPDLGVSWDRSLSGQVTWLYGGDLGWSRTPRFGPYPDLACFGPSGEAQISPV